MDGQRALEMLKSSPIARELLISDPTAGFVLGRELTRGEILAKVADETRHAGGVQALRKALTGKPQPRPGATVRLGDGRTGRFLASVTDALAYVAVDGFTFLLPFSAITQLDDTEGDWSASAEIPGGTHGGYAGAPASVSASASASASVEAEKGWLASLEGQCLLAKATISPSAAPKGMGFDDDSEQRAREFKAGDAILHRPTARRARYVRRQGDHHSVIQLQDGSLHTVPHDELEASEEIQETRLAGNPALPPFSGDASFPPLTDAGRRNLVGTSAGAKAAWFASQQGQSRLAKLIGPATPAVSSSGYTAGTLGEAEEFEARLRSLSFDQVESLGQEIWKSFLRNHPEARPLAKSSKFGIGDRVRHAHSGKRGQVISVDGRWRKVQHADGSGTAFYDSAELEADSAQEPLRQKRDYSRMEYGGYSNVVPRRH